MNSLQNNEQTLSVSQLNRQVKRLLESHFGFVWVEGEISNLAKPGSSHWYFSLKDGSGQVRCAMFRNSNQRVQINPANGQQVRIRARVSLYEGRGEFQLIVEFMEAAGSGALQLAFEQLKQKLLAEGLFEHERKRALPTFPSRIGIITSPTGAAIQDIVSIFRRRFPAIELDIWPVLVQGDLSAPAVTAAIEQASQNSTLDALILTRGGGSIEDLWSFNDERVARAVADSELPVVSAIGHELDFTICDFVADVRAPTPSAAAELLSPDQEDLLTQLETFKVALKRAQGNRLHRARTQLRHCGRLLRHPDERLQEQSQSLDQLEMRLRRALEYNLRHRRQLLGILKTAIDSLSPAIRLESMQTLLNSIRRQARRAITQSINRRHEQSNKNSALLHSLGPQATLERGYAIVTDAKGSVISSGKNLTEGSEIQTRLANGKLQSTITDIA